MDKKMEVLLKQKGFFEEHDDLYRIQLVQKVFSELFPFENLDVLLSVEDPITPDFLIDKCLNRGRGGVCYELNGLMHIVLKELSFDVFLTSATVATKDGWVIDRTHAINLYKKQGKLYAIDSGSGNNLPLQPMELDGDPVTSPGGTFRLRTESTERGSIVSEKKSEDGWFLRYAFHTEPVEWEDLNRIKHLIHHHPESPFNEKLLIAQILSDGPVSINEERLLRRWPNSEEEKIPFSSEEDLLETVKQYFQPSVYVAVMQYINKKSGNSLL